MTDMDQFFPIQGQAPERVFPAVAHGILNESEAAAVPGGAGGRDH
jgi:hypothetical protein